MTTSSIPDPPASASKWLDLAKQIILLGLVPSLLLGFVSWRDSRREDKSEAQHAIVVTQMREDLKYQQAETGKVLDKLLSMMASQQAETRKDVKDVKSEVRATTDAVKATQPTAPAPP